MGDQSKHMATRAVSTCTRMMILGLFLGVLAVTSEPTDMHDPGQVEAKLTNEVIPESEWGPVEFLERPARGSDKKPPELQLSQAGLAAKARLEAAKNYLFDFDKMQKDNKKAARMNVKNYTKLSSMSTRLL